LLRRIYPGSRQNRGSQLKCNQAVNVNAGGRMVLAGFIRGSNLRGCL